MRAAAPRHGASPRCVALPGILLLGVILTLVLVSPACGDGETTGSVTTGPEATATTEAGSQTTVSEAPTTESTGGSTGTSGSPSSTGASLPVSEASLTYAEDLGGTSHLGQDLHLVIGASVNSENEAQALLEEAIPKFGDMQSYFIVQRSDNFEGLEPGSWIVIEAYRNQPSAENLDFGRRGFPDAYVEGVTVLTSDPIPVYEELVEGQ
jgi:hypothetical protein